jgi:uncharacterized protein YegL/tRNA A-37 threonylcarbamoyl transferase component Bud32
VRQSLELGDPQQLGDYELLGRLGQGRMWRTFYGVSSGGREVAVKVIHPELAAAPGFRARFAGEVARVRAVRGNFLVPVVDADADAEQPWVATGYVAGPSLSEMMNSVVTTTRSVAMPPGVMREVVARLAEGLRAIHDAGLVHGSFTPSNILLEGGLASSRVVLGAIVPMITDFGFSRDLAVTAGPADDIFGFGLVVFSAAIRRPLESRDQLDTSGLPGDIRLVVDRCLNANPGKRPTAAELADKLGGLESIVASFPAARIDLAARVYDLADDDDLADIPDACVGEAAEADQPDAYHADCDLRPLPAEAPHNTGPAKSSGGRAELVRMPGGSYQRSYRSGGSGYVPGWPRVPLGERTDPLPHDGLFIRRNSAFGTKSTLGISDLIEQGVLIDQDRIRFDDFVASRTDAVPVPTADEAVAVSYGLARTVPDCRASQHATHFVEIALRAADSPGAAIVPPAPLPVNFVFVVDTSGSMQGEKLEIAKRSIRELYDQLRDSDILGIVSFDTDARTGLKAVRKADLPSAQFIAIVEGLAAGGGTDLNLGVQYGIHEINRNAPGRSDIVNCLYLFSDGEPTSGQTNWIQIRSNIAAELRGDLTLSCFGFGANARMRELEALAGLTGGHCTQVRRPEEVRLNLAADIARREHLAAINIQLKIETSPQIAIWHLYGHDLVTDPATRAAVLRDADDARKRGEQQFGAAPLPDLITEEKGIRIFAPDLAFGETYWIVLELAVPDGMDLGDLGTATVQYVDALARQARRQELALGTPGQLPEAVVAAHAIGLWTSEVTFYALDDLYENDRATAKERLTRHINILRAASQHVPAPQFADDQVTLAKLISLTGNLSQPRSWDDSMVRGAGVPMQVTMHAMNEFGRVRGGYARRYF